MSEKTCFKCNKKKPLDRFYKHPKMADGHLGKCKECTKKDVQTRYYDPESRPKVLAYERERFTKPERKKKLLEYQRARRKRNPGKSRCRNWVSNAIRDGRLERKPCEVCGDPKSQAHHEDYRRPSFIKWLCFKHHRELEHGQIVTPIQTHDDAN